MTKLIIPFLAIVLGSCGDKKSEKTLNNKNDSLGIEEIDERLNLQVNRNTANKNKEEEIISIEVMPLESGYFPKEIDEIEWDQVFDSVSFSNSNTLDLTKAKVGLSMDYDPVIEILRKDGTTSAFLLKMPGYDLMGLWGKLSLIDFDGNGNEELVYHFEISEGTSGFSEGYEYNQDGLCILDLEKNKVVFQETSYYHYMEYSGPEEQGDTHAKQHEDSEVSSCDWEQKMAVDKTGISIADVVVNNSDHDDCEISSLKSGKYYYNSELGLFEK